MRLPGATTQNINWNFYSNAVAEFKTGQVAHEALMGVSYTGLQCVRGRLIHE